MLKQRTITSSSIIFLTGLLCACAPFKISDHRAPICNELNSKIIFSGSTGDPRRAAIQQAEEPLEQQAYDKRCAQ